MPEITYEELQHLSGLFVEVEALAEKIKRACPEAKVQCEQIRLKAEMAYATLTGVQGRGPMA